jgi:uncharacterized protein (TIRG00374 family)
MEPPAPKRLWSKPLQLVLALGISGLTLYLAFRQVDAGEVQRALLQVDWGVIGLAFASGLINNSVKVWRWKILLGPENSSGYRLISTSFFAAQMLNAILPVRVGEISRIYALGRDGSGHAFVLGTVAVEKILDLAAYALLVIGLILLIPLPGWLGDSMATLLLLAGLLFSGLTIITFKRDWIERQAHKAAMRLPVGWQPNFQRYMRDGLASLAVFDTPLSLFLLVLATALIWITAILTNWLVMLAMHIDAPAIAAVLILVVLQAGISLPSLPGKIGILEYLCILSLAVFGVGQATGLGFGVMLHVIIYLPIFGLGVLSFWALQN